MSKNIIQIEDIYIRKPSNIRPNRYLIRCHGEYWRTYDLKFIPEKCSWCGRKYSETIKNIIGTLYIQRKYNL